MRKGWIHGLVTPPPKKSWSNFNETKHGFWDTDRVGVSGAPWIRVPDGTTPLDPPVTRRVV